VPDLPKSCGPVRRDDLQGVRRELEFIGEVGRSTLYSGAQPPLLPRTGQYPKQPSLKLHLLTVVYQTACMIIEH
jgi:hypothetical protein